MIVFLAKCIHWIIDFKFKSFENTGEDIMTVFFAVCAIIIGLCFYFVEKGERK